MAGSDEFLKKVQAQATRLRDVKDADILFFCGPIYPPYDEYVTNLVREKKQRRPNLLLLITTYGGSAHAAYRIARCLRRHYNNGLFEAYVDRECLSAGTLLILGADSVVMDDSAQLGPLDVQLRKTDEVGERSSGLTAIQALNTLQTQSFSLFKDYFLKLRYEEELGMGTKLAAEIATNAAVGLFKPVYEQIDPLRLGEIDRLVKIAVEYGRRLGTKNLKDNALERLVAAYPSHEFLIDRAEAEEMFKSLRPPSQDEERLAAILRDAAHRTVSEKKPIFFYLPQESEDTASHATGEASHHDASTSGGRENPPPEERGVGQAHRDDGQGDPATSGS